MFRCDKLTYPFARYGAAALLAAMLSIIEVRAATPLEVNAIIRTAPDKPEQHQIFRGPTQASKNWHLCVILPNVSDNFWDEVAAGVREESKRMGATTVIYEASGYTDAGMKQQEQILRHRCGTGRFDAVLLAAISGNTELDNTLKKLRAENIIVIDLINGYDSTQVDGRAFLDNYHVGMATGEEIKNYLSTHPTKAAPRILWVPGPKDSDWARRGDEGFKAALGGSTVQIETLYFRPHYREQRRDLRQHLKNGKTYDLIIGSGPTATAAHQLKTQGIIPPETPIFAYYATPDVLMLLAQGKIIGTVSNEPKIQGRIGVALVTGLLEKIPVPFQIGPEPVLLKP